MSDRQSCIVAADLGRRLNFDLWVGVVWCFFCVLIGWRDRAREGSNVRRLFTRLTFLGVLFCLIEAFLAGVALQPGNPMRLIFIAWSPVFFFVNILGVFWLAGTHRAFTPDPWRLLRDILLSGAISILGMALLYRSFGVENGDGDIFEVPHTALYFSTVTFSTLGYGDFKPSEASQLYAGLHAIYGNIHLGLLAGAVFFGLQKSARA